MTARAIPMDRTYLYAPTSNHRILAKVLDRPTDAVVLDLEDGVSPEAKPAARVALAAFLDNVPADLDVPRLLVRINRDGEGWSHEDLQIAVHPAVDALSLPKAEDPAAVVEVADQLARLERERSLPVASIGLHLLVESARGVDNCERLARIQRVQRFGLGAADLCADLGIFGDPHPAALDHVRSRLVVASRAAEIGPPVDSVHTDFEDIDGLRAASRRARGFGFHGKSAIHPSQLRVINVEFTPSMSEQQWAAKVVAASHEAAAAGAGAIALGGEMVDAPVLARARAVLQLAAATADSQTTTITADTTTASNDEGTDR